MKIATSRLLFLITILSISLNGFASHKIYLLHGFGGLKLQMEELDKALSNDRYITENYSYQSISEDLDTIGKELYLKVKSEHYDTVSFITHSMGGLVVRAMYKYIAHANDFPKVYRIVMIAPPNGGTEVADFFAKRPNISKLSPNISHMTTDSTSLANQLPKPNCEVGIIAGIRGRKPWFNPFLKSDNDGTISNIRTRLGVETDYVEVVDTHDIITLNPKVVSFTTNFIRSGHFVADGKQQ